MSEEIFDIVNERDEVVGQNTRRDFLPSLGGIFTPLPHPASF
jgi:hypothetical protein